ncbi:Hypothetical protein A7982_04681 [Minicystis rosea]|nr:Hypothetical protein A7982_04681 [Minicystis rosea]
MRRGARGHQHCSRDRLDTLGQVILVHHDWGVRRAIAASIAKLAADLFLGAYVVASSLGSEKLSERASEEQV